MGLIVRNYIEGILRKKRSFLSSSLICVLFWEILNTLEEVKIKQLDISEGRLLFSMHI